MKNNRIPSNWELNPDERKPHYELIPVRVVANVYKVILTGIIS